MYHSYVWEIIFCHEPQFLFAKNRRRMFFLKIFSAKVASLCFLQFFHSAQLFHFPSIAEIHFDHNIFLSRMKKKTTPPASREGLKTLNNSIFQLHGCLRYI